MLGKLNNADEVLEYLTFKNELLNKVDIVSYEKNKRKTLIKIIFRLFKCYKSYPKDDINKQEVCEAIINKVSKELNKLSSEKNQVKFHNQLLIIKNTLNRKGTDNSKNPKIILTKQELDFLNQDRWR